MERALSDADSLSTWPQQLEPHVTHVGAREQRLGLSAAAFRSALAGSWGVSGVART